MDEVQKAIKEELKTLPKRFHKDYLEMINSAPQTLKSVRKSTEFFLDEIMNELTEEEINKMFIKL